jgi:hypothetical protein
LDMQKHIVQTFIKEVLIYERHCEIVTIVPADNGGEPLQFYPPFLYYLKLSL